MASRHAALAGLEPGIVATRAQVAALQAQVGRWYGPRVPADLRISMAPWPIDGKMTPILALAATSIPQMRANAYLATLQPGSPDFERAFSSVLGWQQNFGSVSYVSMHIDELVSLLSLIGDSLGLAPAPTPSFVAEHPWMVIGAVACAILLFRS